MDLSFLANCATESKPGESIWLYPEEVLAFVGLAKAVKGMVEFYEWDSIPFAEHGLPEKHVIEALRRLDAC